MQLKKNTKHIAQWSALALVIIIALFQGLSKIEQPTTGYDEQMWTSSSIASYNMFCRGYVRHTTQLDNWFPTYAFENNIDIFKGGKILAFKPDTIKFPYDIILFDTLGEQYSAIILYDTLKFTRSEFQWFDRALWTFGWKAPNFGKYLTGWWLHLFANQPIDPEAYFVFKVPVNNINVKKKMPEYYNPDVYKPSPMPTGAPYSYTPGGLVELARVPHIIFYALNIGLVFLFGWRFLGFWSGFVAGIWLLLNASFLNVNSNVGLDSTSTFFTTSTFFLSLLFVNAIRKRKKLILQIVYGVGLGAAMGLAVSSKLNGALAFIVAGSILGGYFIQVVLGYFLKKEFKTQLQLHKIIKTGILGIVAAILGVFLFIQLNPQVKLAPKKMVETIRESANDYFERRATIFTNRDANKPNGRNWLQVKNDWNTAFALVFDRLLVRKSVNNNYYNTMGKLLPFRNNPLDFIFLVIGIITIIIAWRKTWKNDRLASPYFGILVALVVMVYGNTNFLWQDWVRYFTPMLPIMAIISGLGVLATAEQARRLFVNKNNQTQKNKKRK